MNIKTQSKELTSEELEQIMNELPEILRKLEAELGR